MNITVCLAGQEQETLASGAESTDVLASESSGPQCNHADIYTEIDWIFVIVPIKLETARDKYFIKTKQYQQC